MKDLHLHFGASLLPSTKPQMLKTCAYADDTTQYSQPAKSPKFTGENKVNIFELW